MQLIIEPRLSKNKMEKSCVPDRVKGNSYYLYLLLFSLLVKKLEFPAQSSVLTKPNKVQIS